MTIPSYRGIYVDNFKLGILPDLTKQTALLKWAKQNNFNTLSLYLDDILDSGAASPTRAALAAFISNAKTNFGITGVTAVESRDYMLVPSAAHPGLEYLTIPHYNDQRTAASQKIDAVQLELDWWPWFPPRLMPAISSTKLILRAAIAPRGRNCYRQLPLCKKQTGFYLWSLPPLQVTVTFNFLINCIISDRQLETLAKK